MPIQLAKRSYNPILTVIGLALLLLAACGADRPLRAEKGGPALWRVEKDGVRGHVFGTIHVLPRDTAWTTGALKKAEAGSDRLVLEATGLEDEAASQKLFVDMGRSAGLPPVAQRLPEAERPALKALIDKGGMSETILNGYESWAAALLLSTVVQGDLKLSGGQGVEPALTQDFREAGKPVEGLETIAQQFGLFDHLPEDVQRRMLGTTVRQSNTAGTQFEAMLRAWISGDMKVIARDFVSEVAPEPAMAKALLTDRNRAWAEKIAAMKGRPFVAVGAAHLAGPENLLDQLKARGFKVVRVQ